MNRIIYMFDDVYAMNISVIVLFRKSLLCIISILHYVVLAHLVAHIGIALHVVIYLI